MKTDNCFKIHEYLLGQPRSGQSIYNISRELGISVVEIKEHLQTFKKSFVRVGSGDKYSINRFSSNDKNALELEIQEKNSEKSSSLFWGLILTTIFLSLVTIIISTNGS